MTRKRVRDDLERWDRLFAENQAGTHEYCTRTPYRAIYGEKLTYGEHSQLQQVTNYQNVAITTGSAYRIEEHSEGEAYFLVRNIYKLDFTGRCFAAGFVFLHTKHLNGAVIEDEEEIVWVVDVIENKSEESLGSRAPKKEYELIPVDDLMERCNITFRSTKRDDMKESGGRMEEATASSCARRTSKICRLVYFRVFPSQQKYADRIPLPSAETIRPLNQQELAALGAVPLPGTAISRKAPISHDNDNQDKTVAYTFADICHGPGGATEGAKIAGIKPVLAIEIDAIRHATYTLNNPDMEGNGALLLDVRLFSEQHLRRVTGLLNNLVLHISPMCVTWSQAKAWPCEDDSENARMLFEVSHLVSILKPRMLVIENVPGLVGQERHRKCFHILLGELVDLGYSVSWGVFKLHEYGNPSVRRRVFVFAAAPGEHLPRFPEPTHGSKGSGLHPFVTVKEALSNIPEDLPHHDVGARQTQRKMVSWDDNQVLKDTLTTSAYPCHPSALRDLTVREFLKLNAFPDEFEMVGKWSDCRKQIADSIPPGPFAVFLKEVVRTLGDTDEGKEKVRMSRFEDPLVWLKK
jgi:site-specific DNA-cytosine methylase